MFYELHDFGVEQDCVRATLICLVLKPVVKPPHGQAKMKSNALAYQTILAWFFVRHSRSVLSSKSETIVHSVIMARFRSCLMSAFLVIAVGREDCDVATLIQNKMQPTQSTFSPVARDCVELS